MSALEALGNQLADAAAGDNPTRIRMLVGTVVSVDWVAQTVVVNLDTTSIVGRIAGQAPVPGKPINVMVVGQQAYTLGRQDPPPLATVTGAPSAGLVQVRGDDQVLYTVGFQTSYTPAAGHRVLMDWDAGGHIVNRVDAAPVVVPPEENQKEPVNRSQQFRATDSGSFRSGWSSGVVYYGQSYPSAGWFYGTQIADTIPSTATIRSVQMYLEVTASSGQPALPLFLHTSASRPAGSLALDNQFNAGATPNGFRGNINLPTSWGDLLKTGARRGIGTTGPGYRRLNGPAQSASAGALVINWTE
jgi:hypothetical protein